LNPPFILTVAEMGAADAAAAKSGVPTRILMQRAGEAVAKAVIERFTPVRTVVLCGPGDNGGDGYVAAQTLAEAGWPVEVACLDRAQGASRAGAAASAAADWKGRTTPLGPDSAAGAGLTIDALFGAGLSRALDPAVEAALAAATGPVVAVDLPSGLQGDTGRPLGKVRKAVLTVTFHGMKLAHVLEPGRSLCGEVRAADIGLVPPTAPRLLLNQPSGWAAAMPWPGVEAHKHQRGRLAVVGGRIASTGAARLAARAGLRVGAGLSTVLTPPGTLAVNAAALEAVMVRPFEDAFELERFAEDYDAVIIGPGAGVDAETIANLEALARTGAALVVDADALTVFRPDPDTLYNLLDRDDVLTPHVGEFERIFPGLLKTAPERVTAARRAAELTGAVVLLKGPDTVIAAPDGRAAVNGNAPPWLATAGSGDVLAGLVGGLIAQGMESFEAACAGAWIHGAAAEGFGPGLISEDLPGRVPPVLDRLWRLGAGA
jgi:hydroxyethylthiazole kinase-like uncharacterized protein yjeF